MKILLKPELEKFVAAKLTTGQYSSASDVVNEALEVLKDQEDFSPEHEAYIRREIERGLQQLDRGEHAEFDADKIITEERDRLKRDTPENT
jgi:antitoxin ParD1/3/4